MAILPYVTAAPTVLATISRYAIQGSPHPALSLQDLIKAALFKKLAADSLSPENDQSSYDARLALEFSPSVTVSAVSLEPLLDEGHRHYYDGELSHPLVAPQPVPAFFLTPKKRFSNSPAANGGSRGQQRRTIVLYFHGGGYGRGNATGTGIANALANKLGQQVCTIDYRLGTHTPFPAAVQDCVTAYLHLLTTYHYDPADIFLIGESAGAGLVLATLLHLRSHLPSHQSEEKAGTGVVGSSKYVGLPGKAILLSPFMQTLDHTGKSYSSFDPIDIISTASLPLVTKGYVSLKQDSPYIQLLHKNSFNGLPPLFVSYGDAEIFCDDDRAFCEHARRDGVEVVEDIGIGKVHVWIALPHEQKVAKPVWARMKRFLDGENGNGGHFDKRAKL